MIERIKDILSNLNKIDAWKIIERKTESSELFFVLKDLDMNRAKNVHHFKVTVYKDFEEEGKKYRGSSTTNIHPTMSNEDIEKSINDAAFGASFIKNQYYPLVKPSDKNQPSLESDFSNSSFSDWLPKLTKALYGPDVYEDGWINSSEFFLNKVYVHIINSEGVDVEYETYNGEIEFITNWKGTTEEIELFRHVAFANPDLEMISESADELLTISRERAFATQTPNLNSHTVLLSGDSVKTFFQYYYQQSNAQNIFDGVSSAKLNENIQGNDIKGDLINIKLDPFLKSSVASAPYDDSGYPLNEVQIFDNGVLSRYWGDSRYSYYLDVEPTGLISNVVVEGGSKSVEDLKKNPYLEIVAFSDFQMNHLTGDFAGELRLGWYFDGNKTIPVTGGAISGNINEVHGEMFLSKELQYKNNFVGPKTIQLFNVSVSGS